MATIENKFLYPRRVQNFVERCGSTNGAEQKLGDEEEMKNDAKDALGQALHSEELHVRGEPFVGNHRGLSFANYKVDQADLRARVDAQDKISSLEVRNASLEDRVSSLTNSLDAYKLLKNRFISSFKRDKLGTATGEDRKIIGAGNNWAHGGDVVVDAQLYQGMGGRRDTVAFKKLYGISPGDIQMISHQPSIDIMNVHAKIAASKHQRGSDEFYARFAKFIQLFEESGYDEGYLEGNGTDVTRAYWAFLHCIHVEVTAAEVSD